MKIYAVLKWIGTLFTLSVLSLTILLAIGQIQLYLLTSSDWQHRIELGFPYPALFTNLAF